MGNFIVVVITPDDPDTHEYYGTFESADLSGDSEHDAVTWMFRYIQEPVVAVAVEMFSPASGRQ